MIACLLRTMNLLNAGTVNLKLALQKKAILSFKWPILRIQKRCPFLLKEQDIHYETHLELNLSKCFCPNLDLGVLWLKDAIIPYPAL